jgi:hypothetical protein
MRWNVTSRPGDAEHFGEGFAVVSPFEARFEPDQGDDLPYAITLRAALQEGRFVVESLCAERLPDGEPVTSEGIRGIGIASLLREVTVLSLLLSEERGPSVSRRSPIDLPDLRKLAADGVTDEVLRYVALIYRLGFAVSFAPTGEVVEAFGISRATAGRWIAQARERGYLGKAADRRAGEFTSKGRRS